MTNQAQANSEGNGPLVRLRIYHDLEKPRSGRQILIFSEGRENEKNVSTPRVRISAIQTVLDDHVDSSMYTPHVYTGESECFVPLTSITSEFYTSELAPLVTGLPRIDVKLVPKRISAVSTVGELAKQLACDSSDTSMTSSWFAIGILRGKTAANHGTLWRSALQFGAAMTFTIGKRYEKRVEGSADVYKTLRQIPCMPFPDVATFMASCPVDAQIVVVEYGGTDLTTFTHPKRAMYVLGSEDCGIPPALVARAQWHISVPTAEGRPTSLNVATTGAIIMYDRLTKMSNRKCTIEETEFLDNRNDQS